MRPGRMPFTSRRIYKIYTDPPSCSRTIGYPVILLFEITGTVVKTDVTDGSRAIILRAIDHERCRVK